MGRVSPLVACLLLCATVIHTARSRQFCTVLAHAKLCHRVLCGLFSLDSARLRSTVALRESRFEARSDTAAQPSPDQHKPQSSVRTT